jgi:hypothetical protein
MKRFFLLICFAGLLVSCGQATKNTNSNSYYYEEDPMLVSDFKILRVGQILFDDFDILAEVEMPKYHYHRLGFEIDKSDNHLFLQVPPDYLKKGNESIYIDFTF